MSAERSGSARYPARSSSRRRPYAVRPARVLVHRSVPALLAQTAFADLQPGAAQGVLQHQAGFGGRVGTAARERPLLKVGTAEAAVPAGRALGGQVAAVSPVAHSRGVDAENVGSLAQAEPLVFLRHVMLPPCACTGFRGQQAELLASYNN